MYGYLVYSGTVIAIAVCSFYGYLVALLVLLIRQHMAGLAYL